MKSFRRFNSLIAMVCVILMMSFVFSFDFVFADDNTTSVDQVNITVPVSCSVVGTIASGGDHTAPMVNSQYLSEIGTTTFKTYCNDNSGYAIYAIGYSNDEFGNTLMKHNSDNTRDFDTGTATSGQNSDWAMKLSAIAGTYAPTIHSDTNGAYTAYHVVPSTYTKVVSFGSNTDLPATGVNAVGSGFSSTYAVWVSATQVAGTYTGKVRYTLVHPSTEVPLQPQTTASGKICYYPNASTYDGTMGCQTVSTSATTAKLFASNFSRAGYGFAGWSDAFDYATNANAHFYGPNEDITFTAGQYTGSNPGLSLYAVWIPSAGSFQDVGKTTTVCNGLTVASVSGNRTLASVSALTDTRDNQTYAIAKLADGNCWMIENLRLDNTAQLTTLNTNNPLNDGTNVTLKHNYTDTQAYNTLSATSNVAYNAHTAPDGWCTANSAACDDQSRLRTDNTANRVSYASGATMSTSASLYSYGNYYNWYSATAGRGTYGFSTNNNSTAGDLCPTNWRLPQGGNKTRIVSNDDNEFWNLIVDALNGGTNPANYASSTTPYYDGATEAGPVDALIRTWPNNFIHSGYVNGASLNNRGSIGYYWSSTAYSSSGAYLLYFYSTYVSPGTNNDGKYYGWTIRCMVSPSA